MYTLKINIVTVINFLFI